MTVSAQRALREPSPRARIEDLLDRYPQVSTDESAEILRFLKKGGPTEVALLTSTAALQPKLQRFRDDHASEFRLRPKDYAVVATVVIALLVTCFLLWDAGI